jgi:hypothetical protein
MYLGYVLLHIRSFYEICRSGTPSVVFTTINEYMSVCVSTEKSLVLVCTRSEVCVLVGGFLSRPGGLQQRGELFSVLENCGT